MTSQAKTKINDQIKQVLWHMTVQQTRIFAILCEFDWAEKRRSFLHTHPDDVVDFLRHSPRHMYQEVAENYLE